MGEPEDFEPKARGVCRTCGTMAESPYGMGAFALGGASISSVQFTITCITCGDAIVMADLQTLQRDGITVVGTSDATATELLGLVEELRSGSLTPEQAAGRIEERAPWLAPLAEWLRANGAYAGWLSLVVTIIFQFIPSPLDGGQPAPAPPSEVEVERILREILEELQTPASTTPAPPGTSPPAAPPPPAPSSPASLPLRDSPSPPEPQL